MIFQVTWQEVLSGAKTETVRLVKAGEALVMAEDAEGSPAKTVTHKGRTKWQVGRTYAVQPGRNEKSVGRIHLSDIGRKRVQSLTDEEALAEGAQPVGGGRPREAFRKIWNEVHGAGAWDENPEVWVLTFSLVEGT